MSLPPSAVGDMLSFNQQGVTDNSFSNMQQWPNVQPHLTSNVGQSQFIIQVGNSTHQTVLRPNAFTENYQNWHQSTNKSNYYQPYGTSFSSHFIPNQFQANQVPVQQSSLSYPISQPDFQPQNVSTPARFHKARITLMSNSSGGFKAIVKRKRKRTMFTTEQVEVLESVFQRKPYVSREDREILVKQLQLTDTSVKVWFQNRRLRGKRELEEAAEEAFYNNSEDTIQLPEVEKSIDDLDFSSRLDQIESELNKKVDEAGYITLDDKSIEDIVTVIDSALSPDISLDVVTSSSSSDYSDLPSLVSDVTERTEDSDRITPDSVYEPISPADSESVEETVPSWKPFAPDESLQKLFDLHFC